MNDELTGNMPDPQDQVAPFLGRELERWWWRNARQVRNQLRRQAPVADAAHLVAVPAVVADHLRPGSGICWVMATSESVAVKTEVAVDLGVEAGAVDEQVGRGLQRHFLHGEGVAQDVLGQGFEVGLGLGWHLLASVDVEATVFPCKCSRLPQAQLLLSLRLGLGLHLQQVGVAGPTDRRSRQAHLGSSGSRGGSGCLLTPPPERRIHPAALVWPTGLPDKSGVPSRHDKPRERGGARKTQNSLQDLPKTENRGESEFNAKAQRGKAATDINHGLHGLHGYGESV